MQDIFGDLEEFIEVDSPKPKPKPKKSKHDNPKPPPKGTGLEAVKTKNDDGTTTKKLRVNINEVAVVGEDDRGDPIRSWVLRDRQLIAREILNRLQLIGVEIFNTNGYISCYDSSTQSWHLLDEPVKISVFIDSFIRCVKGASKNGNTIYEPIDTPKNISEFLTHSREEINKLDYVENMVRHPYFDDDLNIVNKGGYNKNTKCYLPDAFCIDDDAHKIGLQEAYDIFEECFGCMNYKEEVDKQSDLAAFLTPPWKHVAYNSPIVCVTSNAPGSGKGLRQRVFNSVWTKSTGAVVSKPKSEDELKKQLFATLRSGISYIFFDNISEKLFSDVLCSYATEPDMSDRAVYGRTMETYRNNLFISVNGNNMRLSEDIATRILPIHFDITESSLTKDYAAEGRKTEAQIIDYAKNNRDKIIGASLRISKEFIRDTCPTYPLGGSRIPIWQKYVLGSIYHMCDKLGQDYLLANNVIKAKIEADPESQDRARLFKAILDIIGVDDQDPYKSKPFYGGTCEFQGIFDIASYHDRVGRKEPIGHNLLGEYISGNTERARQTQVGVYLRDRALNKIHYGWRLVKTKYSIKVNRAQRPGYRLVRVNENDYYVPGTEAWERPVATSTTQVSDDIPEFYDEHGDRVPF